MNIKDNRRVNKTPKIYIENCNVGDMVEIIDDDPDEGPFSRFYIITDFCVDSNKKFVKTLHVSTPHIEVEAFAFGCEVENIVDYEINIIGNK